MFKLGMMIVAAFSLAGAAQAVTFSAGPLAGVVANVNDFEGIGVSPDFDGTFYNASSYTQDGITVSYVGTALIWATFQPNGLYAWYPNGGGIGYTEITFASGLVSGLQLSVGSGWGGSTPTLFYEVLLGGSSVLSGAQGGIKSSGDGYDIFSFSGGSFDTVRVAVLPNVGGALGDYEAGAFDDVKVISAIPEPATWAMLIIGFGLVGSAARRRAALTA